MHKKNIQNIPKKLIFIELIFFNFKGTRCVLLEMIKKS